MVGVMRIGITYEITLRTVERPVPRATPSRREPGARRTVGTPPARRQHDAIPGPRAGAS